MRASRLGEHMKHNPRSSILSAIRLAVLATIVAFGVPVLAQDTTPSQRPNTPETARDPQVGVPETADDIDHTKEDREKAVKKGAVKSAQAPVTSDDDKTAPSDDDSANSSAPRRIHPGVSETKPPARPTTPATTPSTTAPNR